MVNNKAGEEKCPECEANNWATDHFTGETICGSCGLVGRRLIDARGPRNFGSEDEKRHTHNKASIYYNTFTPRMRSCLTRLSRDSNNQSLSSEKVAELRRQKRLHDQMGGGYEQSMMVAIRELERLRAHLDIPKYIAERAFSLFQKALQTDLVKGRSIEGMVAAALYISAKKEKRQIFLREVNEITHVDASSLNGCIRHLVKGFAVKHTPTDFRSLAYQIGEKLDLTMYTCTQAANIALQVKAHGLTLGRNPLSIVAACLYLAGVQTGERRTQRQIAEAAKTTPVTIRNRLKEIIQELGLEDLVIKRGLASLPVYASNPRQFLPTPQEA
ncbi:MAG: transcription initiation factor IIB family protein [Candidatus Hodarchaeota archaeon]